VKCFISSLCSSALVVGEEDVLAQVERLLVRLALDVAVLVLAFDLDRLGQRLREALGVLAHVVEDELVERFVLDGERRQLRNRCGLAPAEQAAHPVAQGLQWLHVNS
jgi:hypothetical protein